MKFTVAGTKDYSTVQFLSLSDPDREFPRDHWWFGVLPASIREVTQIRLSTPARWKGDGQSVSERQLQTVDHLGVLVET